MIKKEDIFFPKNVHSYRSSLFKLQHYAGENIKLFSFFFYKRHFSSSRYMEISNCKVYFHTLNYTYSAVDVKVYSYILL